MAARATETAGPVTLIVGEEEFLVDRAIRERVAAAAADDVHDRDGGVLAPGELQSLTSPSLFGGGSVVVIRSAQNAGKDVTAELTRYLKAPADDVTLILAHAGGAKGKDLLAAVKKAPGVSVVECPKVTRFSERLDFIRAEFRRAGKRADDGAARALLDAVGSDLRELASACGQLAADTEGQGISESAVATYYRGRAEATGFSVADQAVEGHLVQAVEQLRWALDTGVSPVLINSALAQGLRLLGRVGSARGMSSAALAGEVGAPPWKIDRVKQQLRGWHPAGIAVAMAAVAEADAQVKGEGVSAAYALERAIRRIVAARDTAGR